MGKEIVPSQTPTLENSNPTIQIEIGGTALKALKIDALNHDYSLGTALAHAIAIAKAVEGERIFVKTPGYRERELVPVK